MEKNKRWQLVVILMVLAWTLYNIFPTLIYYSKPLHRSIEKEGAESIERKIASRVNSLEGDAVEWVGAFCSMVGIKPTEISVDPEDSGLITLKVSTDSDMLKVKRFLPRAGMQIVFKPSQLFMGEEGEKSVRVVRKVGIRLDEKNLSRYFRFLKKRDEMGVPTDEYFSIARDRFVEVAFACAGPSYWAKQLDAVLTSRDQQALEHLSGSLRDWQLSFEPKSAIQKRLLNSLFQGEDALSKLESCVSQFRQEASRLKSDIAAVQEGEDAEEKKRRYQILSERYEKLSGWLQDEKGVIESSPISTREGLFARITNAREDKAKQRHGIVLERHPFIQFVTIDWAQDQLVLDLHHDVVEIIQSDEATSEQVARRRDAMNKIIMGEMGWISQETNEKFRDETFSFQTALSKSPSSNSVIALSIPALASQRSNSLLEQIKVQWQPESIDLQEDVYPRLSIEQYKAASSDIRNLSLLLFSPSQSEEGVEELHSGSLYVILKGGMTLLKQDNDGSIKRDIDRLTQMLQQRGFVGYSGEVFGASSSFARDIVFELDRFYESVLEATREEFFVPGMAKVALLECGTWEDRILAENRIDDLMQEELIKWREAWQSAQVSLNPMEHFSIPKPTKSVFWSNLKRSWRKYWRGDDSRIVRWGLDLSGGKSVRVGLVDQAGTSVTSKEDLQQVSNELYTRLNKMGVSERTIRVENETILIDFPGVHGVSASELIKASAMYFHVVNEKFGPLNADLEKASHAFLQDVWNEAVVTNCKSSECINRIALRKFNGVRSGLVVDDNIQQLLDNGLLLESPAVPAQSTAFDDQVCMIARYEGEDPAQWSTKGHPLTIVFKNFALEGCNLDNVHSSYDPSKGNILLFGVRSADSRGYDLRPRDEFYTWTSQFCEEGILGTERERLSRGRGWRMAVILNGSIVSAPTLSGALRDNAMISGNFSQREVQMLAANLQAGSLSFTPKILSEVNVSPELGKMERRQGLVSALLAVVVVAAIMITYYRYAGFVASVAVLGNLLIIWAVMQNIEAAITLPAIAGIVLTVAMAVDANVLVFERIREEFLVSKRILSSIARGYQKALSAIVDSNLTTLIAAFILTQFDCGPVRGFALTLIIGLLASLFTALFVTRYYFTGWANNPEHTHLKMMSWIRPQNIRFLSWKKVAFTTSALLIVIGVGFTSHSWKTMLGMDFTGGYALVVDVTSGSEETPKQLAEKALLAQGLIGSEIQIRELGRPTALRIQLSSSLEEEGHPFYGMPQSSEGAKQHEYQKIPRLDWVVSTLEKGGITISPDDLPHLVQRWTAISGQFSGTMRTNALIALGFSLLAILIYIAIRFEWKYAISAVLALVHDVLVTISVLAIFHAYGLPVQINLEVIGALMTIIGYSLNDTIIVFDRVREDMMIYRKKKFSEVVNKALNDTLSRTIMTSLTTLAALACLVFFGGGSIFSFSFVMFTGVLLGTLSSLFIAGPLLVFFHHKEEKA